MKKALVIISLICIVIVFSGQMVTKYWIRDITGRLTPGIKPYTIYVDTLMGKVIYVSDVFGKKADIDSIFGRRIMLFRRSGQQAVETLLYIDSSTTKVIYRLGDASTILPFALVLIEANGIFETGKLKDTIEICNFPLQEPPSIYWIFKHNDATTNIIEESIYSNIMGTFVIFVRDKAEMPLSYSVIGLVKTKQ